jgi:hypothetical protein
LPRHHCARGFAGAVSRIDAHVDHRDAAGLDGGDRLTERRLLIGRAMCIDNFAGRMLITRPEWLKVVAEELPSRSRGWPLA